MSSIQGVFLVKSVDIVPRPIEKLVTNADALVGQIKSVSHKNLSLDGTSSKFGIPVLQDTFSQKVRYPQWKAKWLSFFMVAV